MSLAELILDENIDQVLALNTDFEVIAWNKASELATGISKDDIMGKSVFSLFPEMKTDPTIAGSIDAALKGYKSFVPHGRLANGDGQYVERHFVPLKDTDGKVIGISIIIRDVPHRLKAENELRALNKSLENFKLIIDSSHDIIITFDVDGHITYWNAAAERLFGYPSHEVIGKSMDCLMPEDGKYQLAELMNSMKAGVAMDKVIKQRTKGGNEIDVAVNAFPLIDENSVFVGGCKIARDFTEIVQYRKSIETLNNELTIRNRQLAAVHYELKTFTNIAVNNYSETLRQLYLYFEYVVANDAPKLSDSGKANIRKAQAAIQKMKLLTNDMISFTRLSEFDTEIKPVNLNVVVRTIGDDLKQNSNAGDVELVIEPLPEIKGYPFLISLVFHHLLENSFKFRSDKKQPVIKVSAAIYKKGTIIKGESFNDDYNVITIQDNGIGFPMEQAAVIFQIFTRLHPGRYKGSGIGLAICRKALELHNGFITTDSALGKGSAFHCFFPCRLT